jgi:serine/threonine-protein kinase
MTTTDELIGKTIGGYQILDVVGKGGMATVYRAQQVSMNRVVAVKVLPVQFLNDDTYLQRFNQEVAIVSKLEHRSIVPVHDYGEHNGQPYIVMRYMPGGSVDDLLNDGPLEPERILDIYEQIAPALDYAHSKNVLHRDLKPSNILLDDDGGAYLTDFGIARVLGEQQASGITTQGVVGTPSYMSPEQAQGLALDGRSDIYALGIMLFELATGRRPFESDTPYGVAVLQVTAPPPSPRTYNPQLSFAFEQVIYMALRKKREERYPNAVALVDALKRALNKPVMTVHDTQPSFQRPPVPQAQPQMVQPPPAQPVYALPSNPAANPAQVPSGYSQPVPRRRPSRPSSLWVSAAVGALLGCGVLAVVALIALIIVSNMASGAPADPTRTPSRVTDPPRSAQTTLVANPTLDPTSEAARATLVPRSETAEPAVTASFLPVGVRPSLTPNALPSGLSGMLIFFAEREGNADLFSLDLVSGVETQLSFDPSSDSYPSVSPDGRWIAFQSDRDGDSDIYVMDIEGRNQRRLTENEAQDRLPNWSPDGAWIVFSSDVRGDGTYDVYTVRPDGTDLRRVFTDDGRSSQPRYSPDGRYLVFTTGGAQDGSTWEIGRLNIAAESFTRLTNNAFKDWSPSYSPDGSIILYLTGGNGSEPAKGSSAIAIMDHDGNTSRILYDGPGYEWGPVFSPDGAYITFTTLSDETGQEEVFVMSADGRDVRQLTAGGGLGAVWVPGTS